MCVIEDWPLQASIKENDKVHWSSSIGLPKVAVRVVRKISIRSSVRMHLNSFRSRGWVSGNFPKSSWPHALKPDAHSCIVPETRWGGNIHKEATLTIWTAGSASHLHCPHFILAQVPIVSELATFDRNIFTTASLNIQFCSSIWKLYRISVSAYLSEINSLKV